MRRPNQPRRASIRCDNNSGYFPGPSSFKVDKPVGWVPLSIERTVSRQSTSELAAALNHDVLHALLAVGSASTPIQETLPVSRHCRRYRPNTVTEGSPETIDGLHDPWLFTRFGMLLMLTGAME